jgi:hypothetical protein
MFDVMVLFDNDPEPIEFTADSDNVGELRNGFNHKVITTVIDEDSSVIIIDMTKVRLISFSAAS